MLDTLHPASEILLRHGPYAVTLRASLRVAVALENLSGGIAATWEKIARQKLSALFAVIRTGATDRQEAERLLTYAANHPLGEFIKNAQAACLALIVASLPMDQGDTPKTTETASIPLRTYFSDLFRYATGWLGWPPSEVWNACPAELEAAFLAHLNRVTMMMPDPEKPRDQTPANDPENAAKRQANIAAGLDPEFDREALRALKVRHGV